MIRIADYIIRFLEKKGIHTAFTMSGGGSIFLCDAKYTHAGQTPKSLNLVFGRVSG